MVILLWTQSSVSLSVLKLRKAVLPRIGVCKGSRISQSEKSYHRPLRRANKAYCSASAKSVKNYREELYQRGRSVFADFQFKVTDRQTVSCLDMRRGAPDDKEVRILCYAEGSCGVRRQSRKA